MATRACYQDDRMNRSKEAHWADVQLQLILMPRRESVATMIILLPFLRDKASSGMEGNFKASSFYKKILSLRKELDSIGATFPNQTAASIMA